MDNIKKLELLYEDKKARFTKACDYMETATHDIQIKHYDNFVMVISDMLEAYKKLRCLDVDVK